MNIITDFPTLATIFVAAILIALAFFILALQVFVALIAFKLGSLAAFVALPWGVFSGTAWVAERPLGWVATSAVRLFLLAFVVSVSVTFVEGLPAQLSMEDGGVLDILLFACTILALSWLATALASEVMSGSPSLSGAQPAQAAAGGAASMAGVAVTTRMLTSGGGMRKAANTNFRGPKGSGPSGPGATGGPRSPAGGGSAASKSSTPNYGAMSPKPRSRS